MKYRAVYHSPTGERMILGVGTTPERAIEEAKSHLKDGKFRGHSEGYFWSRVRVEPGSEPLFIEIDEEKLRSFVDAGKFVMTWEGCEITDPYVDESGRVLVNPIAYYGDSFIIACLTYGLLKYPS